MRHVTSVDEGSRRVIEPFGSENEVALLPLDLTGKRRSDIWGQVAASAAHAAGDTVARRMGGAAPIDGKGFVSREPIDAFRYWTRPVALRNYPG
jgi:hypothetical protein